MKFNIYDIIIVVVIALQAMGLVQIWIVSSLLLSAIICFPCAIMQFTNIIRVHKIKSIILFFLCWFIYASCSIVWTIDEDGVALTSLYEFMLYLIVFIGLFYCIKKSNTPQKSFLLGWTLLSLLTFPIAFWEINTGLHLPFCYTEGFEITGADGLTEERIFASTTFANLNTYVSLLCVCLPFMFSAIFVYDRYKWFFFVVSIISIVLLLINSSRGGMLVIIIDLFLFLWFYYRSNLQYKSIVSVLVFVIAAYFLGMYGDILFNQLLGRLDSLSNSGSSLFEDSYRGDLIIFGLELSFTSFGIGWGIESMNEAYAKMTPVTIHRAHNFVVEFLIVYGWPLFIVFAYFFIRSLLKIIRHYDLGINYLGYAILCSFLPWMVIDDTFFERKFVWFFLMTIFLLPHIKVEEEF
ncbi:MAG: O-antigen ligase family protein [Paludibacteraceae bacterium]|nr:O-antigen ligase family protein [Paludibacteraceae bacterium]